MSPRPRVSIVVPVYNVEPYLQASLDALAAQTFRDIEVLLVDDGSTDASPQIAGAQAERDPRFRLLRQPNSGPGAARNLGIAEARGEYLGFLDGDDLLTRHAIELLVATLDRTGSDLVTGQVRRFSPWGVRRSQLHERAIVRKALRTSIRSHPELFYDVVVWNKLYRRSFWDRSDLRFPEGVFYEDVPVAVIGHLKASAADILTNVVAYWRVRTEGELSTTQKRGELSNFLDRMNAIVTIDRYLTAHDPGLKAAHDAKVLDVDLRILLTELLRGDDDYRSQFMKIAGNYLDTVAADVAEPLPAIDRLRYHLLRHRQLPELLEVLKFQDSSIRSAVPVRQGRRWYADFPYFRDRTVGVPDSVYELRRELELRSRIDDVYWEGDRLHIVGYAYINLIDIPRRRDNHISVVLRRRAPGTSRVARLRKRLAPSSRRVVPVTAVERPDVTAAAGREFVSYHWSGFHATLDASWLLSQPEGTWNLWVHVRAGGLRRLGRLGRPNRGRAQRPAFVESADGRRVRPYLTGTMDLNIDVRRPPVLITDVQAMGGRRGLRVEDDGGTVVLTGRLTSGVVAGGTQFEARRREGAVVLTFPVEPATAEGDSGFRITLDLEPFLAEHDVAEQSARIEQVGSGLEWDCYLVPAGGGPELRVALDRSAEDIAIPLGRRELVSRATRNGNLTLTERTIRPIVTTTTWTEDGRLVLTGRFGSPDAGRLEFVLHRPGRTTQYTFPATRDGTDFTVELTPARVERLAGVLALDNGRWEVFARLAERPGDLVTVKLHAAAFDTLAAPVVINRTRFTLGSVSYDSLILTVEPDLQPDEMGPYAQRRLRDDFYPLVRRQPLEDAVLFECWSGKQYSDSPRAIYEELLRRGDTKRHVWVIRGPVPVLPGKAEIVRLGSRAHFEAAARARYVVDNDVGPKWFSTRPDGQRYLQTWHGTPLKRIGFDIQRIHFKSSNYLDVLAEEVPNWTSLVSPNPVSTEILRRAFRFDGTMFETGYPRNDILFAADRDRIAEEVRRRLGLPAGKRVVMYAPTWRDNEFTPGQPYRFSLPLDIDRWRQVLGDDWVLLVRGHHLTSDAMPTGAGADLVVDVSDLPDIAQLYLVTDVLLTDYSSAAFDFANTGRPILYFVYDLESYRDNVRGFYFSLEDRAAGPLLRTSDDVIDALLNIDQVHKAHSDRYAAFVRDFCAWDDGHAAARVVDRLFGD